MYQKHRYCRHNNLRTIIARKAAYIQYRLQHHIELFVHPSGIIYFFINDNLINSLFRKSKEKLLYTYREIKNVDGRATRTAIDEIIMTHQAVNRVILLAANRTKKQAGLCISYSYRLVSRSYDENSSWTFIRRFKRKNRLVRKLYTISFNAASLCKKNLHYVYLHYVYL